MSNRVPVMVFLPVGVCSCSQVDFLGRVYQAVRKYNDVVDYQEYTAESSVAKRYGVSYRGVVVGSKLIGNNPTTEAIEEAIQKELEQLQVQSS